MAAVWDCRNVEACYKMWKLDSGVTTVAWNEHNPLHFLVRSSCTHCVLAISLTSNSKFVMMTFCFVEDFQPR